MFGWGKRQKEPQTVRAESTTANNEDLELDEALSKEDLIQALKVRNYKYNSIENIHERETIYSYHSRRVYGKNQDCRVEDKTYI